MKQVMVRYKVKPDRAAENEELVRAVYDELGRTEPAGLRYATFQLEDGVSFVHLAMTDTDGGRNPLSEIEAFKEFQREIEDRCEETPVVSELREIGSFRFSGDQGGS
jgi:L-rhamnose mutarotase